ncbi:MULTISPECIES: DUF664 domain-containing protein [unclassified Pseudonocardia]|uniref:mycothiol transferase n=1 Tax=unclassified Pseudonocardia TaxID=2619320 RepID=UPI00095C794B|nr:MULTISPECIES: DUF664 domain-containing protein [unclassified Pseudonocardia]MBN9097589.1 DUF664 domain-containing protein [Pseudonocardia sp.]OJY39904.1 MAG: hypothetical protein BGP03_21785 [Pseudonocardia sp. 73-21]
MLPSELLIDAFDRVRETVHAAVADLTDDQLAVRLDADANSIAWLVWHLTRVQDDHLAGVSDLDEVWTAAGWSDRFGLPFPDAAIGYGQGSADVAKVRVPADLLLGYHDAVHAQTVAYLRDDLTDDDLERVVDERWDPPVTLAVRLVSVVNDTLQHAGQAAFVRGIVLRAT